MEYTIVTKKEIWDLKSSVQSNINDGWVPVGGIGYGNGSYLQAMVREEKPMNPFELAIKMGALTPIK